MTVFWGRRRSSKWDGVREQVNLRLAGEDTASAVVQQARDEMMRAQADAFVGAARGGDGEGLTTFDEGAFEVALCDAARRSSASGRFESIEDWRQ